MSIFRPTPAVNGLFDTNYIDQMRTELIGQIILEGKTLSYAHLIPGVKNRVSLNTLDGVGSITSGACGWPEAPGEITLTQRELIVADRQIKDAICPKDLEKTFMGMYMKSNKEVPFIATIADFYVKTGKKDVEHTIWQGGGITPGLFSIADTDADVIDASADVDAEATYIGKVNALVSNAPAEVLEREDAVIVMNYSDFVAYQQELIAANLFHYDANVANDMTLYVPGTNIKVRATAGLNNATVYTGSAMILTYEDNIAVGTDGLDGDEMFDIWYSKDNDEVRVHVSYKIGSNFFFPNMVVKGYVINAPVPPVPGT